jgi:hypothetical protein
MAERRITQLLETPEPNITDVLPIVNTGTTKKVQLDNFVKASTFSTNKINILNATTAPDPAYQLVIQSTTGTTPIKVSLLNIYPVVQDTSTINLNFNSTDRNLQASIIPNSLDGTHLGTGVVQTTAIADGAITEAKIDSNAKIRGATGGGTDRVFYENDQVVTTAYTITSGKNAMTAGPITISDGIEVTVPSGSTWTVV